MKQGRQYDKQLAIGNVATYATQWCVWWVTLQPAWRGTLWPLLRTPELNKTWDKVQKGGRNGVLVVILSLGWWVSVVESDVDRHEATSAVEYVMWVLQELMKYPQGYK